jgi:hypothetical protein
VTRRIEATRRPGVGTTAATPTVLAFVGLTKKIGT